jgi:hypothetical protein
MAFLARLLYAGIRTSEERFESIGGYGAGAKLSLYRGS